MKGEDTRQKTSATRIAAAERRLQIMELRMAGATVNKIAAALGHSKSTVSKHLNAALAEIAEEVAAATEATRALEVERLDRVLMAVWPHATKGSVHHVDRVLRIMERRATLLGLDAPKRTELSGRDGGPIRSQQTLDLASLTDEELAEIERITTAARSRGLPPGVGTPPA